MKYVQRLVKFISPLIICGNCFGADVTFTGDDGVIAENVRPTVRQWNEFQETQEELLEENRILKGRVLDLVSGQQRLLNRLNNIDNNFLNLINVVNETNNIIQGDNANLVTKEETKWLKIAIYAAGGFSVLTFLGLLFRGKQN